MDYVSLSSMSDDDLGRRIAEEGCQLSMLVFRDRYKKQTYNRAYRRLRCAESAEWVVSEALRNAFTGASMQDATRGTFAAWFSVIVKYRIIDAAKAKRQELRKKPFHFVPKQQFDDDDYDPVDHVACQQPDALGAMVMEEEAAELTDAICDGMLKLTQGQRLALVLRMEGYSAPEMAEIMLKTQESVECLLARARQRMRDLLADDLM